MSCAPQAATFRLLDSYVGWDPAEVSGLTGLADPDGLRLASSGGDPDALDRQALLPWFPDPRLAPAAYRTGPGCPVPDWYLLAGPDVLRRDGCGTDWAPLWPAHCAPPPLDGPTAVTAAGHRLAVADRRGVRVWWRAGEQLESVLPEPDAAALALSPGGYAYVARRSGTDLWRYRPGGAPDGVWRTGLPGRVAGLRVGPDRSVWLLADTDTGDGGEGGGLRLWRAARRGGPWLPATTAQLAAELPAGALSATWDEGFCLGGPGSPVTVDSATDLLGSGGYCYAWDGSPVAGPPPVAAVLVTEGELRTTAVDSGLPRCRWHRVSLAAEVPDGTTVQVSVAVTEDDPEVDGAVPQPGDWQPAAPGTLDFLVDQPPGRYLYLRLRLTADGSDTPVVRRIRLDFPRATSADLLPPAYLSDPAAEDFTERFLALFDVSIAGVDRVIERYPALLDPAGVPDEVLPWLGGLLALAFESGWGPDVRRALLAAAPQLYRRRGTPWAVAEAVRIVFGVQPDIVELAPRRSWLRLGADGVLGAGRLFGRSAARFRLGTSALSSAPLHSAGDPYLDPLRADAYRLRVVLPPRPSAAVDEAALRRLVDSQVPAHTVAEVAAGGLGFVVGVWSAVGVDTAFVPLPVPVLAGAGDGTDAGGGAGRPLARLGRHSVLPAGRGGPRRGTEVGGASAVGVGSVAW